jgi:hypothetical protein
MKPEISRIRSHSTNHYATILSVNVPYLLLHSPHGRSSYNIETMLHKTAHKSMCDERITNNLNPICVQRSCKSLWPYIERDECVWDYTVSIAKKLNIPVERHRLLSIGAFIKILVHVCHRLPSTHSLAVCDVMWWQASKTSWICSRDYR